MRRRDLLAEIAWLHEMIEDQCAEIAALRAGRDTPAGSTWATPTDWSVLANITRV